MNTCCGIAPSESRFQRARMGRRLALKSSNAQINDNARQNGYPRQALLLVALGQLLVLLVVATPNTRKHGCLFSAV